MASSGAVAQLLTLALTPILTRLYRPEDFGILASIQTYSTILALLLFFSMEYSLVRASDDRELGVNISASLLIFSVTSLVLLSIIIGAPEVFLYVGFARIIDYPYLTYSATITTALLAFSTQLMISRERYNTLAIMNVLQAILRFLIAIVIYYTFYTSISLALANVIALFFASLFLIFRFEFSGITISLSFLESIKNICKNSELVVFNTSASVVNVVLSNFPFVYILANYSLEASGAFALAYRVISMPVALINRAVSNVLLKELSKIKARGSAAFGFLMKNFMLLLICFPFFVLIGWQGANLFSLVFGPQWQESGSLASLLSVGLFFSFCISPLSTFYIAYDKNKYFILLSVVFLFFLVFNAQDFSTVLDFVYFYTMVSSAYYLVNLFTVFYLARNYDKGIFRNG